MAMNPVQFQPGLSMMEFMDRYGTDEKCETALMESRWPSGFVCPVCGESAHSAFRRDSRAYFQCSACRHQCSVTSGTIFEATKLGLSRWFLAMHLLTQAKNNVAALELTRHLGGCYKSAWLIKHKRMEVMRVREQPRQLEGRIEIDDVSLGGERSGGKRGRGFLAVNTYLENLKRSLSGTYHAFDFDKYAHRYLAEARYRFKRRFNLRTILDRLVRAAVLTKPTSAAVIRTAEVCR